jgi:hypothetical protein
MDIKKIKAKRISHNKPVYALQADRDRICYSAAAPLQSGKKPLGRARDSSGNPFLRLAAKKIGADSPFFFACGKKTRPTSALDTSLPTPLPPCSNPPQRDIVAH